MTKTGNTPEIPDEIELGLRAVRIIELQALQLRRQAFLTIVAIVIVWTWGLVGWLMVAKRSYCPPAAAASRAAS